MQAAFWHIADTAYGKLPEIYAKGAFPMRYFLYFMMTLKRCCKRPAMLFLLLLFPLFCSAFLVFGGDREQALCVSVYADAQDDFSSRLADKLVQRDGVFTFVRAESESELTHSVIVGDAECGYVIPSGLVESLNEGKKKNLINVVISSESTMMNVVNEIVYAELFEEYSLSILTDYLVNDTVLTDPDLSEIESLYRQNMVNGTTFSFDYTGKYSSYHGIRTGMGVQVLLGLCSILILLSGFLGILRYSGNAEAQVYCSIPKTGRKFLLAAEIFPPVLLTTVMGIACLGIAGIFRTPYDFLRLLAYSLLVVAFCMLLYLIVRKKTVILFLLPFYLLGCFAFTPIFVDVTLFVPALKPLCMLFLPYYYL